VQWIYDPGESGIDMTGVVWKDVYEGLMYIGWLMSTLGMSK
jgi:hypothetical protein